MIGRERVNVVEGFAPDDLAFVADPYPVYAELRSRAPVRYHEPTGHWLISRYADVDALLRDRRFGRTYRHVASHAQMGHPDPPPLQDPFWWLINNGILDMEPPQHTRVRRLVSKAFTPRRVQALRPLVQGIADRLLDVTVPGGRMSARCSRGAATLRSASRSAICPTGSPRTCAASRSCQ